MKIYLFVIAIFILFGTQIALAIEDADKQALLESIKDEQVNPGSPTYIFKRLWENIRLNILLRDKSQQAKYLSHLLEIRFKELVYTIKNNKFGIIENVSSRYTTTAGLLIDQYKSQVPEIKDQAQNYLPVLEILRDKYPAKSAQWLLLQYTVDTTKRLL